MCGCEMEDGPRLLDVINDPSALNDFLQQAVEEFDQHEAQYNALVSSTSNGLPPPNPTVNGTPLSVTQQVLQTVAQPNIQFNTVLTPARPSQPTILPKPVGGITTNALNINHVQQTSAQQLLSPARPVQQAQVTGSPQTVLVQNTGLQLAGSPQVDSTQKSAATGAQVTQPGVILNVGQLRTNAPQIQAVRPAQTINIVQGAGGNPITLQGTLIQTSAGKFLIQGQAIGQQIHIPGIGNVLLRPQIQTNQIQTNTVLQPTQQAGSGIVNSNVINNNVGLQVAGTTQQAGQQVVIQRTLNPNHNQNVILKTGSPGLVQVQTSTGVGGVHGVTSTSQEGLQPTQHGVVLPQTNTTGESPQQIAFQQLKGIQGIGTSAKHNLIQNTIQKQAKLMPSVNGTGQQTTTLVPQTGTTGQAAFILTNPNTQLAPGAPTSIDNGNINQLQSINTCQSAFQTTGNVPQQTISVQANKQGGQTFLTNVVTTTSSSTVQQAGTTIHRFVLPQATSTHTGAQLQPNTGIQNKVINNTANVQLGTATGTPGVRTQMSPQQVILKLQSQIQQIRSLAEPSEAQKQMLQKLLQMQQAVIQQIKQQQHLQQTQGTPMKLDTASIQKPDQASNVPVQPGNLNTGVTNQTSPAPTATAPPGKVPIPQINTAFKIGDKIVNINLTPEAKARIQTQLAKLTPEQQQLFYKHQQNLILQVQKQGQLRQIQQKPSVSQANAIPKVVPISVQQIDKGTNQIKPILIQNQRGLKRPAPAPLSKGSFILQQLANDQQGVMKPDCKTPFKNMRDTCKRLMRYHVYQDKPEDPQEVKEGEDAFEEKACELLQKSEQMMSKYRQLLWEDSMREEPSAEMVMIERMFIQEERSQLLLDKKMAKENPDEFIPTPMIMSGDEVDVTGTDLDSSIDHSESNEPNENQLEDKAQKETQQLVEQNGMSEPVDQDEILRHENTNVPSTSTEEINSDYTNISVKTESDEVKVKLKLVNENGHDPFVEAKPNVMSPDMTRISPDLSNEPQKTEEHDLISGSINTDRELPEYEPVSSPEYATEEANNQSQFTPDMSSQVDQTHMHNDVYSEQTKSTELDAALAGLLGTGVQANKENGAAYHDLQYDEFDTNMSLCHTEGNQVKDELNSAIDSLTMEMTGNEVVPNTHMYFDDDSNVLHDKDEFDSRDLVAPSDIYRHTDHISSRDRTLDDALNGFSADQDGDVDQENVEQDNFVEQDSDHLEQDSYDVEHSDHIGHDEMMHLYNKDADDHENPSDDDQQSKLHFSDASFSHNEDEEMEPELNEQVQSAINSILSLQQSGSTDFEQQYDPMAIPQEEDNQDLSVDDSMATNEVPEMQDGSTSEGVEDDLDAAIQSILM